MARLVVKEKVGLEFAQERAFFQAAEEERLIQTNVPLAQGADHPLTRNAQRQSDIVLAQLCAENELVKARLSRQMPGVGDSTEPCEQAGRRFVVAVIVRPTPNPSFRRVDAQVLDGDISVLRLSTIVGRY